MKPNFKLLLLRYFVTVLFFGLILLSWPRCFAQINYSKYQITSLTQDDGLSQGSNYFRFEDSKGFMWLTAADAINRYDGSGVKVYNLNKYFSGCTNLQQGYGFAEDNNSNIYVGSDKGLYCYTRRTDKFRVLKIYNNAPDDVAMPFAFKNDKIWCINRFYQIATYNVKTEEIKNEANIVLDSIKALHVYQNKIGLALL